ncbi:hypothetical protein K1719_047275 [Acacia pycnantha]|nr:hypothetical protein K1719_047275 [Acacia pycnantha]
MDSEFSSELESQAVVFLDCSKKLYPDLLFIKLCFLIRCGSDVYVRAKAIRILQFLRIRDFWANLRETAKSTLKDGKKWPELLEFLLASLGKTSDGKLKETAFLVLAKFPRDFHSFICDSLKDSVQVFHSSFLDGLDSASLMFSHPWGNKIIRIASVVLPFYLESPEWQKRHAGITLLALIGKEFSFETVN